MDKNVDLKITEQEYVDFTTKAPKSLSKTESEEQFKLIVTKGSSSFNLDEYMDYEEQK